VILNCAGFETGGHCGIMNTAVELLLSEASLDTGKA